MSKQARQPSTSHRGLSVRRKEFDAVASVFDMFQTLQSSLHSALDSDIKSLQREISLRESMKAELGKVNR